MKVAILGASDKPDRYSYLALKMLLENGHTPLPVHPKLSVIDGIAVSPSLGALTGPVDTLTVYVSPEISAAAEAEILNLRARRVIFNPGTENPELAKKLLKKNAQVVEACTLTLLRTGQF